MHARDDPRVLRYRDGFWFSKVLLERQQLELDTLRENLTPDARTDILRGISLSWQIVDAVYRVRELTAGMPGLSMADARVRTFCQETGTAELLRRYVQHLRTELAKSEVDRFPVWGSFSWVDASDERTCHTAFAGTVLDGFDGASCVFDQVKRWWVSRVALFAAGVLFHVDPIVNETLSFCHWALQFIQGLQPALPSLDRVTVLSVSLPLPLSGRSRRMR